MRIITWNCKGAFHRKHAFVSHLAPDILVVPESEHLEKVPTVHGGAIPSSFIWQGHTPRKGLAVIAYGPFTVRLHPDYDPSIRWILPIEVSGPTSFFMLAVWTLPIRDTGSYVQPLFRAFDRYQRLFSGAPAMWVGDFNANFVFDRPRRRYKFGDFVELLDSVGLASLYHLQHNVPNGDEQDETFFLYHHRDKGYHIDYIFACKQLRALGHSMSLGSPDEWIARSDHVPIVCDFGPIRQHKRERDVDSQPQELGQPAPLPRSGAS